MDLSSNSLSHLPDNLSFLRSLEVLILSHNLFSSSTSIFNPNKLFVAFSSIPRLKRLDLSHNKFATIHIEELLLKSTNKRIFKTLIEIDLSFNQVENHVDLLPCLHLTHLNLINIIGNPFVLNASSQLNGKLIKPKVVREKNG